MKCFVVQVILVQRDIVECERERKREGECRYREFVNEKRESRRKKENVNKFSG